MPVRRTAITFQLFTLAAVVFLTALDQTVVVTALLPMAQTLGLTPQDLSALSWVISGYLLGYVIVMPLMGQAADVWNRRTLLLICLIIFAGGSILCAEAPRLAHAWDLSALQTVHIHIQHPALAWLVVARFIQAVGGGAVVPIVLAESGTLFGATRRSIALGFISGVTEAGGALGPLYGAIILEKWHFTLGRYPTAWMWLFLLNVPLIAILVLLLRLNKFSSARAESADAISVSANENIGAPAVMSRPRPQLDWIGALVLGAALVCISLGLSQQAGAMVALSTAPHTSHNWYLLSAAAVLLLAFIWIESRRTSPLIPLHLFRSVPFTASAVLSLLTGVCLVAALVNVPIFAYAVLSQTHLQAGLLLLRLTVMIPIGAFLGGWLVARMGSRTVGAIAGLVIAAGFVLMSRWTPSVSTLSLTLGTAVTGLGFGLILAPISTTALHAAAAARFGVAAAISTSLRMIGMILGLAALTSWEIGRFRQLFAALRAAPPAPGCTFECLATRLETALHVASAQAMAETFLAAAVVAAIAILPALFLERHYANR